MRVVVITALLVVVVLGCYCRRCQGQEAATATVVTSTEVIEWKESVFNGLNRLTGNPYNTVCDMLLVSAFGISAIPSGTHTAEITIAGKAKMDSIKLQINAALGYAYIRQATILDDTVVNTALDAAIQSATATIADIPTRRALIKKAAALRRD